MLNNLDPHTLAFVSALTALGMAIAMLGIYLAGTRERAVVDWSLAGVFFAVGHMIGHTTLAPEAGAPTALEVALINSSLTLGHGFVFLGIQSYLRLKPWHGTVVTVTAVVFLAVWFWPPMMQQPLLRLGLVSLVFVILNLAAARYLWQETTEGLFNYHRAVAGVLVVYSLFLVLRITLTNPVPAFAQVIDSSFLLVLVFLAAMLFYLGLSVSLSLMLIRTKELHLQFMARHDSLTGLLNRYSMDEFAGWELARARRNRRPFSLVALDLDHFKMVNDNYGHAAGDHVLEVVAERIGNVVREGDIPFRMGGEEFLIMLPDADHAVAGEVAERIRNELNGFSVNDRGWNIPISASFGVTTFVPDSDDWEALLRRADRALYRAKERGRNRVELELAGSAAPAVG